MTYLKWMLNRDIERDLHGREIDYGPKDPRTASFELVLVESSQYAQEVTSDSTSYIKGDPLHNISLWARQTHFEKAVGICLFHLFNELGDQDKYYVIEKLVDEVCAFGRMEYHWSEEHIHRVRTTFSIAAAGFLANHLGKR